MSVLNDMINETINEMNEEWVIIKLLIVFNHINIYLISIGKQNKQSFYYQIDITDKINFCDAMYDMNTGNIKGSKQIYK